MKSMVIYGSRHGNTERIAASIAAGLRQYGQVQLLEVGAASAVIPDEIDLVVIGGPTEGHSATPAVVAYVDRIGAGGLNGKRAATFDTRLRWPRWLSGSAAADIAARLRLAGAELIGEPASFFVAGKVPVLEAGEVERSEAWASALVGPAETATSAGRS